MFLFYFLYAIAFIPFLFVYPCKVVGKKNVPKKGRIIFAPNHQTLNDPIIIAYKFVGRRRFRFMAKAPLFKKKFNNWFMRKMGAFPVQCASADITAIKTTLSFLKKDEAVCIFPEGARLNTSESNDLKHGVAMFALKTQSPIIPACFVKKTMAFKRNKLIIGKPVELYNMEQFKDQKIDKDLLDKASKIIKKSILDLQKNYYKELEEKRLAKLKKKLNKLQSIQEKTL